MPVGRRVRGNVQLYHLQDIEVQFGIFALLGSHKPGEVLRWLLEQHAHYLVPEYIRERMQDIRNLIDQLGLSEKAKRIFAWKFFAGESFADWPGPENRKELYETYKSVFKAVVEKKEGKLLF